MSAAPARRLLVLGSGIAGMSAALTGLRAGADVTVIEKRDRTGGSAALSAGMFWTAPDFDALRARVPLGDAALGARVVADHRETIEELRASGVRVASDPTTGIMTFGTGYSFDVRAWLRYARETVETKGRVLTGTRTRRLLFDGDALRGAVVEGPQGTEEIPADAVILATGGFQGDRGALAQRIGPHADRLVLRSNDGSVGDGLRLATAVGAAETGGSGTFYGHLLPAPLSSFAADDFLPYSQYYSDHCILVSRSGHRFVDETRGDEITNQLLVHQGDAFGVLIFDDDVRRTHATTEPFPGLGVLDRFEVAQRTGAQCASAADLPTLIAMIAEWGVDPRGVAATLDAYMPGGFTDGVPVSTNAVPPRVGPFHAVRVQPSITFTFGGIRIDEDARALDHDGQPVPGLYAAGADAGGLSNLGYIGGLAPAYITGRWAGRHAAADGIRTAIPPAPASTAF